MVLTTVHADRVLDAQAKSQILDDRQYYAERTGMAWPGPTTWTRFDETGTNDVAKARPTLL
jgi:hypothetical protein